jgi:hypothetical protein
MHSKKYYYQPKDKEFCEHYMIEEDGIVIELWGNCDYDDSGWIKFDDIMEDEAIKYKPDAIELTEKQFKSELFAKML